MKKTIIISVIVSLVVYFSMQYLVHHIRMQRIEEYKSKTLRSVPKKSAQSAFFEFSSAYNGDRAI